MSFCWCFAIVNTLEQSRLACTLLIAYIPAHMAWLYKQTRSINWFMGWRVGKKLFNRSTGTSNRKQAEKSLALYKLMAQANRDKLLTEDVYCSLAKTEPKRVPLCEVARAFLIKCKGTLAPGSFTRYKLVTDSLIEYLHADRKSTRLNSSHLG